MLASAVRIVDRLCASRGAYLLVALCAVAAYLPVLGNGFQLIDDPAFITDNPLVRDAGIAQMMRVFSPSSHAGLLLYIPLTLVSWQLTAGVFGMQPAAFHAIDLLLHAANALLVFHLLAKLTERRRVALLAALLFAVHPLHVEAIAWATQRKDLLSACFAFLSFAAFIRYRERDQGRWLTASVLAYACGLLAKIGIAPLPAIFLLYDLLLRRESPRRSLLAVVPYAIIGLPIALAGLPAARQFLAPVGVGEIVLLGAKSMKTLAWLAVFPFSHSAMRWEAGPVVATSPVFVLSLFVSFLLLAATVFFLARTQKTARLVGFGLAWWILFLLPTFMTPVKAGLLYYTSEKYAYLPLFGLILALVTCIVPILTSATKRVAVTCVALVIVASFGVLSFDYAKHWRDTRTLAAAEIARDPGNAVALGNLGAVAEREGDWETARTYYDRAFAMDPANAAHALNAASLALGQGREADLLAIIRAMIPLLTERQLRGDPMIRGLLVRVARDVIRPRDASVAADLLRRISTLVPDDAAVRGQLGLVLLEQGKDAEAKPLLADAILADIRDPALLEGLALIEEHAGRMDVGAELRRRADNWRTSDESQPVRRDSDREDKMM